MLLSVTVLLGVALSCSDGGYIQVLVSTPHHGCPVCGSCIMMGWVLMGWVSTVQDSSWYLQICKANYSNKLLQLCRQELLSGAPEMWGPCIHKAGVRGEGVE